MAHQLQQVLFEAALECRELGIVSLTVDELDGAEMTALKFHKEYLSKNRPVVVRNAIQLPSWTDDYLLQKIGDSEISVALTPDGRADSVVEVLASVAQSCPPAPDGEPRLFCLPDERKMKYSEFRKLLRKTHPHLRCYCQHQNSSLTTEFSPLLHEISLPKWAQDAFDTSTPDAINFWLGDSRSITSAHSDNYENLYTVVRGEKIFLLFNPLDLPLLCRHQFHQRKWQCQSTTENLIELSHEQKLNWILVEPKNAQYTVDVDDDSDPQPLPWIAHDLAVFIEWFERQQFSHGVDCDPSKQGLSLCIFFE